MGSEMCIRDSSHSVQKLKLQHRLFFGFRGECWATWAAAAGALQLYTCVLKLVFHSVHWSRSARYAAWHYCWISLPFQITKTSYRTCSLISCKRIAVQKESNIDKVQHNTTSNNLFSCQRSNIPKKNIIADLGNIVFSPPLSNIVITTESIN